VHEHWENAQSCGEFVLMTMMMMVLRVHTKEKTNGKINKDGRKPTKPKESTRYYIIMTRK
jgi:hypothetical protein